MFGKGNQSVCTWENMISQQERQEQLGVLGLGYNTCIMIGDETNRTWRPGQGSVTDGNYQKRHRQLESMPGTWSWLSFDQNQLADVLQTYFMPPCSL